MATKNELNQRVKVLFEDLKRCVEPPTVQPDWAVRSTQPLAVPVSRPGADTPSKVDSGAAVERKTCPVCPYLRSDWDNATRYGYPHQHNVCYRTKKTRTLPLTYQAEMCLGHQFQKCSAYLAVKQKGRLLTFLSGFFSRLTILRNRQISSGDLRY